VSRLSETRAAREAGFTVAVAKRPGNAPLSDADANEFAVVETFDALPV